MRIFVITGAGISAESGIPTFRGKDGYWVRSLHGESATGRAAIDPTKLATPEAFARDPQLVWEWYNNRRARIRAAEPNTAHRAIANLASQADDFLLVTQNVDDLYARAGLPREKMVQIHGDIFVTRCSVCEIELVEGRGGSPEPPELLKNQTTLGRVRAGPATSIAPTHSKENDRRSSVAQCDNCGALMRPGVVWFGEMLDQRKIEIIETFLARGPADLTLVIGTTALFGYILDWAVRARGAGGELIEINPEETPLSRHATTVIREPATIALRLFAGRVLNQDPDNKSK